MLLLTKDACGGKWWSQQQTTKEYDAGKADKWGLFQHKFGIFTHNHVNQCWP